MRMSKKLVLPAALSLALLAGCNPESPTLPDPLGAEGYCELGWDAFEVDDYDQALDHFQSAIEVDVTYPGGYVGAGWACLYLTDYWIIADNYFYMAIQQDAGYAPVAFRSETMVQDTNWTVFECIDPVLPDSVLEVIGALGDTLYNWPPTDPQDTLVITPVVIGEYLYGTGIFDTPDYGPQYGPINFTYRFHTDYAGCCAMLTAVNNYSNVDCPVDSVVPDGEGDYWVYLMGDYTNVQAGDDDVRTWICADNVITYEYGTFTPGAMTQFSYDAMAGWILLQHLRGANGDPLTANTAVWAMDRILDDFMFGQGLYQEGLMDMNLVQLKGMAASVALVDEWPRFAWFDCTSEGYGLGLSVTADDFLFQLVQIIEDMVNYQE